jgi:uncharacterized membrane protein
MDWKRILRHLAMTPWHVEQAFPAQALAAIERAITAGEAAHGGEIRFAVEGAMPTAPLLRGQSARERAIETFSRLRIWDTEHNSGVLIYLLLADRDVEIVADRGVHAKVGDGEWERICRRMEADFREGKYEAGVIAGVEEVNRQLTRHFPSDKQELGELPDRPVVL